MMQKITATLLLIFACNYCFATHNRAGYITYTLVPGSSLTYRVTITTYTKATSIGADRDSLPIVWGDGSVTDTIVRTNGPLVNGIPNGVLLGNNIKYNTYTAMHTYPGFGLYVISMTDLNRIDGIFNMINSGQEPFFIEDTLDIPDPQSLGYNNSPIITKAPVDFAERDQLFIYNPGAYDPDGDSLYYQLVPCRIDANHECPGYVDPNKVQGSDLSRTFTINHYTGEVDWNTPEFCNGVYNIAILITQWRRLKGGNPYAINVGSTLLDMEIIVSCEEDRLPKIIKPNDTCIVAGSILNVPVTATDPDVNIGQDVTLTAVGGPFEVAPADTASLTATGNGTPVAKGIFTWNTVCNDITSLPYQVVFTAIDNYPLAPLTDVQTWNIKVVAPPPQNLTAKAEGNSIILNWDSLYKCSGATTFIGFSVWRKEGCTSLTIDTCVTGIAGKGYTEIASGLTHYTYTDNNVARGKEYSYVVLAEFGTLNNFGEVINAVASLSSNPACAILKKDLPVITNVSIRTTGTDNGSVYVAWSKPSARDLDTIQNPPPYKYFIYHSPGYGYISSSFTFIDSSIKANTFYGFNDTTYIDSSSVINSTLNTIANSWSYKIEFYSSNHLLGQTQVASSVFLSITSASHRLNLSWSDSVPWRDTVYAIYRKDNVTGLWNSIGTTSSNKFTDKNLDNDSTYCYYVKSIGSYSAPGFIDPIINLSQRVCAIPVDTIGPCPPVLTIKNVCNTPDFQLGPYVNQLIWNKPVLSCGNDVKKYRVYYAASSTEPFQLIDSSHYLNDTVFNHTLANSVAGCYTISGVDSAGNEGSKSIPVCVEACPEYNLPNVFTPNGDDKNDIYHPILPFQYIDRVDMKIFDSWGVLVFQTTDYNINWDGKNMNTNKESPQGTYYYVCDVYESSPAGDIKRGKPLEGFIHLYR